MRRRGTVAAVALGVAVVPLVPATVVVHVGGTSHVGTHGEVAESFRVFLGVVLAATGLLAVGCVAVLGTTLVVVLVVVVLVLVALLAALVVVAVLWVLTALLAVIVTSAWLLAFDRAHG